MKNKLVRCVTWLILSLPTLALGEPNLCPEANSLKASGFDNIFAYEDNKYVATKISQYGSNETWKFSVGIITAVSKSDALTQAQDVLVSVSGNPAPINQNGHSQWVCNYQVSDSYWAKAIWVSN